MKKNPIIIILSSLLIVVVGVIGYWALTQEKDPVNAPVNDLNKDQSQSIEGNAIIDWIDFVKLNGLSYSGLYDGVLVDSSDMTDHVVGEVKFKLADVVSNPDYRTKDGDAAFLAIGTKLYEVKGFKHEELIAAKDDRAIGGYRLYVGEAFNKTHNRNFKDIPYDKVSQIELYKMNEMTPYRTLIDNEKSDFIHLLKSGEYTPNYTSNSQNGDPTYYQMVFYTEDEPIAYSFSIADDGDHVFFHPWDTSIVDNRIRTLLAE
ncbi:hypothetical protein PALU110988_14120 [Paenibacillus lupini]|uniref:hypothetical protein n=1 Tax=Paenibacillus lupini TaxID=1450204 RepID=UPI00141F4E01|nr:hypothetical protein [Paenibacillus lupini]NIK25101.1 hypothetical protein [Paenibacillus lupini]